MRRSDPMPRVENLADAPAGSRRIDPAPRRADWVGAAVLSALCLAPVLAFRVAVDHGSFLYMGAELLHGRWPYLGTWEADYPGLVFLQAAQLALLGKSIVAFRAFDWFVQCATALMLFALASRAAGRSAGWLAAGLFALTYQGWGPWNTAQREGFGLFLALAGLCAQQRWARSHPRRAALAAGLSIGCGFLIKPTLLAFAALYAPLALRARAVGVRESALRAALFGLAAAAPALVTLAIYAHLGGLGALWQACVTFPQLYAHVLDRQETPLASALRRFAMLGASSLALVPIAGLLALRERGPLLRRMLACGYAGALFSVWVQGTFAGYHYLPGLGLGAALLGCAFSDLASAATRRVRALVPSLPLPSPRTAALLALAAAAPLYVHPSAVAALASGRFLGPPAPGEYQNLPVFDFTESWDTAAYLAARTTRADSIQVWGYDSLVYFLADRPAASRFSMTTPLVLRPPGRPLAPMQLAWRAEFLRDLARRPPRYVAVVRDGGWWWAPGRRSSEALLDDFPAWRDFIRHHYAADKQIGRFTVYRWVDPAGAGKGDLHAR